MTPLHYAALNNYAQCTKVLLKAGADVNATNHAGQTPLGIALDNNSDQTASVLSEHGALETAQTP